MSNQEQRVVKAYSEFFPGEGFPVLFLNQEQTIIIDQYFVDQSQDYVLLTFAETLNQELIRKFTLRFWLEDHSFTLHESNVNEEILELYLSDFKENVNQVVNLILNRYSQVSKD